MAELRLAHTAHLDTVEVRALRGLLDAAFGDGFSDPDFEHCLGGLHALVHDRGELIGHGAVIQRRLLHAGRALRTGYLEAVAVRPDRRGEGHAAALLTALERVIDRGYDLGALGASGAAIGLYTRRGWRAWPGPLSALTPSGIEATPDERGGIHVRAGAVELDWSGELTCDWRDGDVW